MVSANLRCDPANPAPPSSHRSLASVLSVTMPESVATSGLDLDPATRQAVLSRLAGIVVSHFDGMADLAVVPSDRDVEAAVAAVGAIDLEHGADPHAVLDAIEPILRHGIVHTGHPGYLGLFNPASSFMGVAGDALAAAFNPQLAVVSHAPAAVAVDAACTELLVERLRLPPGSVGQFTSGGSEANLIGLLVAIHRAFPSVAVDGLHGLAQRPVLYASTEAHHSITKLAQAIGLGTSAVRNVPVDSAHRLDVAELAHMVAEDRSAGRAPFLVVATVGTTSGGAIDPLPAVAAVTTDRGLQLHVDAAWAGAVALTDRHRQLLDGIELADSVTVDAHKWLSAPMGAGLLLTQHAAALERAFAVDAGYMPSAQTVDPYMIGLQWSRRFAGLKVFLALATAGRVGYAAQIDRDMALGDRLRADLSADGWRIRNRTMLPIVCFDDPLVEADRSGAHLRAVLDTVTATGRAWLSLVTLDGLPALRACITSYRTDETSIASLRRLLADARAASRNQVT
jgi:aromatic-L-amino-acid/L-tryptophan decarboxylase